MLTCISFTCWVNAYFSSGISPLLMECMSKMLKHETWPTRSMTRNTGPRKTYKYVRDVFRAANRFLGLVQHRLVGYSLQTDFYIGDQSDCLDVILTHLGLAGMIGANRDNCIDLVVQFVVGMVDRCCDLTDAEWASAFVSHVEIHHRLR